MHPIRWLRPVAAACLTVTTLGALAAGCSELPLDIETPHMRREWRLGEELRCWVTWDGKRAQDVKRFKRMRVVWFSDRDGQLGEGFELRTRGLSQGIHMLEAQVWDGDLHEWGLDGLLSVTVSQGQAPRVAITSHPEVYVRVTRGQPVRLTGQAIDPEEGVLDPSRLTWVVGGVERGHGTELELLGDSVTVTLVARDAVGDEGRARVYLMVEGSGPPPPSTTGSAAAPAPAGGATMAAPQPPATAGLAGALGQ